MAFAGLPDRGKKYAFRLRAPAFALRASAGTPRYGGQDGDFFETLHNPRPARDVAFAGLPRRMNARVKCPTCGREAEWSASSPFRPFCSERCKLIDLGAWLSEQRAIAGEEAPEERDDQAGSPESL